MAILVGVTPSESDKLRHSALASESLTNNCLLYTSDAADE